jgi:hypothetical protein
MRFWEFCIITSVRDNHCKIEELIGCFGISYSSGALGMFLKAAQEVDLLFSAMAKRYGIFSSMIHQVTRRKSCMAW